AHRARVHALALDSARHDDRAGRPVHQLHRRRVARRARPVSGPLTTMPQIYERLGVRPIINARGTHTRLGGTLIRPEVLDAMREAAKAYVVLDELQDRASEVIARATGAEAGVVVGGAEAGLLIGTAAIMAGTDPAKIAQ